MTREQLARRVQELGLELRESADVVEVGEARMTPCREIVVEHVIHEAGILLVLWRATSRDDSRVQEFSGSLGNGAAADGQRYSLVRHPAPDRRQRLAWHEPTLRPRKWPPQTRARRRGLRT